MARLYANEDFPLPVVMELRRLGQDVVTGRETGKANRAAPDVEILEFARAEKRAVLTLNRKHFIAPRFDAQSRRYRGVHR
jgi:predicted nuclease of predicted toxin-antitoxin system